MLLNLDLGQVVEKVLPSEYRVDAMKPVLGFLKDMRFHSITVSYSGSKFGFAAVPDLSANTLLKDLMKACPGLSCTFGLSIALPSTLQ